MTSPTVTSPTELADFDLTGPLPEGTVVLEASAGTGKTYAIAGLATRYVAEAGVPLPELLLVTFTRAATAELGDRVRRRLREAATHLEQVTTGGAPPGDALLGHLADASPAELRRRLARLQDALTVFDTATIATIHSYCQQTLRAIGLSSAVDRDAQLLEDEDELVEQVVADLLVARYHAHAGAPGLAQLHAAVRAAVGAGDAAIEPAGAPSVLAATGQLTEEQLTELDDPEETGRRLAELTGAVREEVARRKRARGWLSQDDLLTLLRDTLVAGPQARSALVAVRARTRVALVDEFQDTDPVQWDILERAFGSSSRHTLVLIGDPKQAIYSFRGADVRAYLDATDSTDDRRGLRTNWRSDGPLVAALDGLFAGTTYGEREIVHRPVVPAADHQASRLTAPTPDDALPLEVRAITRVGTGSGEPAIGDVRDALLPNDVAAEVVRTLQDRGTLIDGRPVQPGDIAILVRANRDAPPIQQALRAAQVPTVLNGVGNVFASEGAAAWQSLLDALERPSSATRARRFAVSGLGGWTASQLAEPDEQELDRLHGWLTTAGDLLRSGGVPALLRETAAWSDLPGRLLGVIGGERLLTDLQHVAQLLERARLDQDLGPSALGRWLRDQRADAGDAEVPPEAQARRLESDADAVQLLTVHRAKGLEFPIVLVPTPWAARSAPSPPVTVHVPGRGRVIDVGPTDRPGYTTARQLAMDAQSGEDLRVLYVALTRARHRVVVWWVANQRTRGSALARVLFARRDGMVTDDEVHVPSPGDTVARLTEVVEPLGGRVTEVPPSVDVPTYQPSAPRRAELERTPLHRAIDRTWRRTSYSALTATIEHGHASVAAADVEDGTEDTPITVDEPTVHGASPASGSPPAHEPDGADDGRALASVALPLAGIPGSAELGTMVHAVLEHADYAAPDLRTELDRHLQQQAARAGFDTDLATLLDGLCAAVSTPLGPLAGGIALRDVRRRDRLDEPRFELPIAGGDEPGEREAFALTRIGDLLDLHLADDDPLRPYIDRLDDDGLRINVRGYLNGAIDLVLRVRDGADERYLVVDHKTNRLGWPDEPTAWHYRPAALTVAMMDAHYPLQGLLYTVALHRLLRWRRPGYDPDRHLGGMAYLFLRGMTGPDGPTVDGHPCGVFAWRPPTSLVLALDDLVAGRGVGGRGR